MTMTPEPVTNVSGARILALFGDSITTDHISPAGDIQASGPAGRYLRERGVPVGDFNSYGARRGNHEVMMRGTFANIRIRNHMVPGVEGGVTLKDGRQMAIYDAAMDYIAEGTPLVIFAGKEYGTGSSRDWAAKGTRLLGVRAVIAESFERIHRSNLIGMGVLPLQLPEGVSWKSLGLTGAERIAMDGVTGLQPRQNLSVTITCPDGNVRHVEAKVRIDTENELDYFRNGGILHFVLRELARAS
jgi:aconitate hydratase